MMAGFTMGSQNLANIYGRNAPQNQMHTMAQPAQQQGGGFYGAQPAWAQPQAAPTTMQGQRLAQYSMNRINQGANPNQTLANGNPYTPGFTRAPIQGMSPQAPQSITPRVAQQQSMPTTPMTARSPMQAPQMASQPSMQPQGMNGSLTAALAGTSPQQPQQKFPWSPSPAYPQNQFDSSWGAPNAGMSDGYDPTSGYTSQGIFRGTPQGNAQIQAAVRNRSLGGGSYAQAQRVMSPEGFIDQRTPIQQSALAQYRAQQMAGRPQPRFATPMFGAMT
jgi:hypothetical protein